MFVLFYFCLVKLILEVQRKSLRLKKINNFRVLWIKLSHPMVAPLPLYMNMRLSSTRHKLPCGYPLIDFNHDCYRHTVGPHHVFKTYP